MSASGPVIDWLLSPDDSDPSIRFQVMRHLLHLVDSEWAGERARVELDGWGARLLTLRADGLWEGAGTVSTTRAEA